MAKNKANYQLSADAHIIIAGSEGARGDMLIPDFNALAKQHFNGDLAALHEAIWKIFFKYRADHHLTSHPDRGCFVARFGLCSWSDDIIQAKKAR